MKSHSGAGELVCRFAQEHERARVIELFDEAFAEKFRTGVRDATLRKKLFATALELDNVLVAVRGADILGIAVFSFYERPGFRSPKPSAVLALLGVLKTIRAAIVFSLFSALDWKPKRASVYLEAISVSEHARGHGVGTLLLQEGERIGVERHCRTLELSVVLHNEDAHRLYLRHGFREIAVKRSFLLNAVTGVAGARLMALSLQATDNLPVSPERS